DASEILGAAGAGANHRDVQLVVQVPRAQNRGRADRGSRGRQRPANELPPRDATVYLLRHTVRLVGSQPAPNVTIERRGRKGRKEEQYFLAAFAAFAFYLGVSRLDTRRGSHGRVLHKITPGQQHE